MTFQEYLKTGSKNPQRRPSVARSERYKQMNKHINFDRESEKSNARKDPTEVTCIRCKKKFILPFKPRKPEIYCDACFKKQKKSRF